MSRDDKVVTEDMSAEDMGAVSVSLDDTDAEKEAKEAEERTPPDLSDMIPLNDFLVIWPAKAEKHSGKIHLLEGSSAATKGPAPDEGEVLAAGPDCKLAKVGDYTFFWKHAGSIQFLGGKSVRLIKEREIYAKRKDPMK